MARRRKRRVSRARTITEYEDVIRWTSAVVLIACGALLALGAFGASGPMGDTAFLITQATIGIGAFVLPLGIIALGLYAGFRRPAIEPVVAGGATLFLAAVLAFAGLFPTGTWGGRVGSFTGHFLESLFGFWGALVLLLALTLIALATITDVAMLLEGVGEFVNRIFNSIRGVRISLPRKDKQIKDDNDEEYDNDTDDETDKGYDTDNAEEDEEECTENEPIHKDTEPTVTIFNKTDMSDSPAGAIANFDAEYEAPTVSLLGTDKGKPGVGDIKANTNIIKRTFQNFGISVEMDEVTVGPTVTRYAFKPAEGVRLSRIVSLHNNLELALAAHPVRIEAPIPGKSLVGIEVPNTSKATVGLGGLISAREWSSNKKPLLAALGRDITGRPHYIDIAKTPHALVAGATGAGKSVAVHALIASLLYRNGPNQLRFIMVDPKRVELTLYNGIPHLLTPVITDHKKSILALKWAAKEMERRYNILEAEQVRDIESYHDTIVEPAKKRGDEELPEAMPYIVIVIDELAEIMQAYPRELEASVVRLASMSRAVGIHLLLSTQRPSVNVITGLIKANVPTRMALQVTSQIDSRTILDSAGAEQLLGAGDMLYLSSDMQKPIRVQTAYISETEVKKVVQYIKKHNSGDLISLNLDGKGTAHEPNDAIMLTEDADDELYSEARATVEEAGRASTSYLQRKLRIGYSRAARLMDILEERGIIGPADGSRPREILAHTDDTADIDDVETAPESETEETETDDTEKEI
ncbi:DNA translocase FtsK [hydrothermal vent metagenome]|uniref:DNA translocase FtsK n=1 Tax=hydrothermal vent metagenome TaxID=652676 RepID=A0A3B0UN59_9ZZZZ